jgi:hypothetical protein
MPSMRGPTRAAAISRENSFCDSFLAAEGGRDGEFHEDGNRAADVLVTREVCLDGRSPANSLGSEALMPEIAPIEPYPR